MSTPRAPGTDSSKMMGSSQRAWWKRRGVGLGRDGVPAQRRSSEHLLEAVDEAVDLGLVLHLGHRVERALPERGELPREVGAAEDAPLEQRRVDLG